MRLKLPIGFAVPLVCSAGLWLVLIYRVAGETDPNDPRFALHWLRDATLAFPVVLAAVWVALRIADGVLERRGEWLPGRLGGSVTAAAIALAQTPAQAPAQQAPAQQVSG